MVAARKFSCPVEDESLSKAGALLLQVLQGTFSQLKQRLLDSKPEDFGLSKDCDWNVASPQGGLHQGQAGLLLGCLEVVIEDVVDDATGTTAFFPHVASLKKANGVEWCITTKALQAM